MATLLVALVMALLTGCASDDLGGDTPAPAGADSVTVTLHLSVDDPSVPSTRATVTEPDADAVEGEWMKSWVIVAVQDGKVEKVMRSTPYSGEREHDAYTTMHLETGSTTFYAFANLTDEQEVAIGLKTKNADGTYSDADLTGKEAPAFASKTLAIDGNQATVDAINGGYGIPMSSKATTFTIEAVTTSPPYKTYEIELVRMVAKIQVVVQNTGPVAQKVGRIVIEGVTKNPSAATTDAGGNPVAADPDNLCLLPGDEQTVPDGITVAGSGVWRSVNLNGTPTTPATTTFTYDVPASEREVPASTVDADGTRKPGERVFSFYVNESQMTPTADNPSYLVTVYGGNGEYSTNTKKSFSFTNFTKIARNEIHRLPVELFGLDLEFDVEAFTAIGVLPTCTERPDYALIDLGMYGSFHITPYLREWATGKKLYVATSQTLDDGSTLTLAYPTAANPLTLSNGTSLTQPLTLDESSVTTGSKSDFSARFNTNRRARDDNGDLVDAPTVELSAANATFSAIYTFALTGTYHGLDHTFVRKFKVQNTAIDFDDLAKRGWWRPSR